MIWELFPSNIIFKNFAPAFIFKAMTSEFSTFKDLSSWISTSISWELCTLIWVIVKVKKWLLRLASSRYCTNSSYSSGTNLKKKAKSTVFKKYKENWYVLSTFWASWFKTIFLKQLRWPREGKKNQIPSLELKVKIREDSKDLTNKDQQFTVKITLLTQAAYL